MRLRILLIGSAIFLIGGSGLCAGMGSGPHPDVPIPYGIAPIRQGPPPGGEGTWLLGSLVAAGILTGAIRAVKGS